LASLGPWSSPAAGALVRYADEVFSSVRTIGDVAYAEADQQGRLVTLRADLYQPAGDTAPARPLIIWLHGGGFTTGDKASPQMVDIATAFARRGYVTASINYRLSADGGCDAGLALDVACSRAIAHARADALDAVAFFRTNAATYRIDPERIVIAGTSAGGITALNVAFSSASNPTSWVSAAVSLSGASAIAGADPDDAPVLLFNGTADPVVPYSLAQATIADAAAAGVPAVLVTYPDEGHLIYEGHRTQIQDRTSNFLFNRLNLAAS
jgi:acetyl esterase/lipase